MGLDATTLGFPYFAVIPDVLLPTRVTCVLVLLDVFSNVKFASDSLASLGYKHY